MILVGYVDHVVSVITLVSETNNYHYSLERYEFISKDYSNLESIISIYCKRPSVINHLKNQKITVAVFGISGSVKEKQDTIYGEVATVFNLPNFDPIYSYLLAAKLEIPRVRLVTDMHAAAYGLHLVQNSDIHYLSFDKHSGQHKKGNALLVSTTGYNLRAAALHLDSNQQKYTEKVIPLDNGYSPFASQGHIQDEFLAFSRRFSESITYEQIISYEGLEKIYRFIIQDVDAASSNLSAQDIINNALNGNDDNCVATLDILLSIYGANVGEFVMKEASFVTGVLYFTGELSNKLLNKLDKEFFRKSFLKGSREHDRQDVAQIPIAVITKDIIDICLIGLAEEAKRILELNPSQITPNIEVNSPRIFIGRESEKNIVLDILYGNKSEWILHFYGIGGIGKTLLLEYARSTAEKNANIMCVKQVVDFYFTKNQQELGVLKNIAEQLGIEHFKSFQDTLKTAYHAPNRLWQTREAFISDYSKLSKQLIIILIDTFEKVESSNHIQVFFAETLLRLKQIQPNTVIISAGRCQIPPTFLPKNIVSEQIVTGLSEQNIVEYLLDSRINIDICESSRIKLYQLSDGKPILIGLFVDWYKHQNGNNLVDLLQYNTTESFQQALVGNIRLLQDNQSLRILEMAHCYRYCDEDILAYLSGRDINVIRHQLKELQTLSFVKVKVGIDQKISVFLHDEMYELVNKYVWNNIDHDRSQRKGYSSRLVEFYLDKISKQEDSLLKQTLQQDCLFYQFDVDIEAGVKLWKKWMGEAKSPDTKDALQHELKAIYTLLPDVEKQFLLYEAEILSERAQYSHHITLVSELIEKYPESHDYLYPELVTSYIHSQQIQKALDLAESLLLQIGNSSTTYIARLYYRMGYAYHKISEYESAIKYYEHGLKHYGKTDMKEKATVDNNIGFLFHEVGQDIKAQLHCKSALRIRQKLANPRMLGLSYNVLGMIAADNGQSPLATKYFEDALECFDNANYERGKALVYQAYGRMLNDNVIWYSESATTEQETLGEHLLTKAQDELSTAKEMLNKAVSIMRETDKSSLVKSLNIRGRVSRHQARFDTANQERLLNSALQDFEESKLLADEVGDKVHFLRNLKDIALIQHMFARMLQDEQEKIKQLKISEQTCRQAIRFVNEKALNSIYLLSRVQRELASVLFDLQDYPHAFEITADSVITLCNKREYAIDNSNITPSKRGQLYIHWQEWIVNEMLSLLLSSQKDYYAHYLAERLRAIPSDEGFIEIILGSLEEI